MHAIFLKNMALEASPEGTELKSNDIGSLKLTINIPIDSQGSWRVQGMESLFTVNNNGELPPDFAEIVAKAQAQIAAIIGNVVNTDQGKGQNSLPGVPSSPNPPDQNRSFRGALRGHVPLRPRAKLS